jgi:hypothetical protein
VSLAGALQAHAVALDSVCLVARLAVEAMTVSSALMLSRAG